LFQQNNWITILERKGGIPINQELRKEIKDKQRLHRKWIRSKHQPDNQLIHESHKRGRNTVKMLMLQGKKDFEKKIGSELNETPRDSRHTFAVS